MYIVMEIQKNGDQVGNIVSSYESQIDAESKYHQILSAAAISSVEAHSAILMSDEGFPIRHECYKHTPAPVAN